MVITWPHQITGLTASSFTHQCFTLLCCLARIASLLNLTLRIALDEQLSSFIFRCVVQWGPRNEDLIHNLLGSSHYTPKISLDRSWSSQHYIQPLGQQHQVGGILFSQSLPDINGKFLQCPDCSDFLHPCSRHSDLCFWHLFSRVSLAIHGPYFLQSLIELLDSKSGLPPFVMESAQ